MASVYFPREDSFLLEKAVSAHAFGTVLDLGTGSGIQAIAAAQNPEVKSVVAVDLNPEALVVAKQNASKEGVEGKIRFAKSDLFSSLGEEKFDCILFNPPYLPVSEGENVDDIALESGESGRELTERFLREFESHLNEKGMILLVQSSLSKWQETKKQLEEKGFSVEKVGSERFFFEEIVVLKAGKA